MNNTFYDKIIIGAGLYGLYAALFSGRKGEKILVLEQDNAAFSRSTYVNQARVHAGYHYPRSISTAKKSQKYFDRFSKDFGFCINKKFDQIYATSSNFSWTNKEQFEKFCRSAQIPCEEISTKNYFNNGVCDGAFLTKEYTYDAQILKNYFLSEIKKYSNIEVIFNINITDAKRIENLFIIHSNQRNNFTTKFVLNATYASTNQINKLFGFPFFEIKYELCEIIICDAGIKLKNTGITVMDGPFFSIMPFGKTGLHSLTSVNFTPHITSFKELPTFSCQLKCKTCSPEKIDNCNFCNFKPDTSWPYMSNLVKKYLLETYSLKYIKSLFSLKPILKTSEIDDSRPTTIRKMSDQPTFISVLSGKINTVYDLEKFL